MTRTGLNRRDFIGTLGGAAASGALCAVLPESLLAHAAGSETLKVGLIGCGGRGTGAAMDALCADPGAVLWSAGDAFADRLDSCLRHLSEEAAARDEESGGSSWRDRLQVSEDRRFVGLDAYQRVIDSGVDVVLLATAPVFRPIHLRAAVDAGKHVFCEKPVAVDAAGVRSVLDSALVAAGKGLSLVSGFCWRSSLAERATMQRVHDGDIGALRAVYTTYNTDGFPAPKPRKPEWSEMEFKLRNWHYFTAFSGDHIVEQACHAIDWIAWAMRDRPPVRCTAVGGREVRPDLPETGNIFDHFAITYEYDDGARAFHMCRHWPNSANDNSAYLIGEEGFADMHVWTPSHSIRASGRPEWKYDGPRNNMYRAEHEELFASIRTGAARNDGERMALSTLMAIMGRMAAYTGKVVTWQQAMTSTEDLAPKTWTWGDCPTDPVARPGITKLL